MNALKVAFCGCLNMGQLASSVASGMKKTMDENFKRQMDFQVENFQLQLERQLALQVGLIAFFLKSFSSAEQKSKLQNTYIYML